VTGDRERAAGLLLHPTSLPGPFGIGDLGPDARAFVDFLARSGMTRWQVLPLGPPGYGDSPYNAQSSFAGNELLISPLPLVHQGYLHESEVAEPPHAAPYLADFAAVAAYKAGLFRRAFDRFQSAPPPASYTAFVESAAEWLDDFALFRALKALYAGRPWYEWDRPFRLRDGDALDRARHDLAGDIAFEAFLQWLFEEQWSAVRERASTHGISIIGDIPMFPSLDSADVWANQDLFKLDSGGQPLVVAGVPPDYFSETGQLWGNPHYDWPRHADTGYAWWEARFRWTFSRTNIVRIDHFRGFEAAWEVLAGAETAIDGEWVRGPGAAIFRELGLLARPAIIAEDLGTITPEVEDLLEATGFPGMKVLHFAFGGDAENPYLPHNHVPNAVAYTGTHDNDTTLGWLDSIDAATRDHIVDYLAAPRAGLLDRLIRATFASVADTAIIPMQDVLELGADARMNTPSEAHGSWGWRFDWTQLQPSKAGYLHDLARLYGRLPADEVASTRS
jgi:4-alpha-glucanotransferase